MLGKNNNIYRWASRVTQSNLTMKVIHVILNFIDTFRCYTDIQVLHKIYKKVDIVQVLD